MTTWANSIDPAKLRAARTRSGYTQAAVADYLGVARQQVWNYEHGKSGMPAENMMGLCWLMNIDPWSLLHIDPWARLPRARKRKTHHLSNNT